MILKNNLNTCLQVKDQLDPKFHGMGGMSIQQFWQSLCAGPKLPNQRKASTSVLLKMPTKSSSLHPIIAYCVSSHPFCRTTLKRSKISQKVSPKNIYQSTKRLESCVEIQLYFGIVFELRLHMEKCQALSVTGSSTFQQVLSLEKVPGVLHALLGSTYMLDYSFGNFAEHQALGLHQVVAL